MRLDDASPDPFWLDRPRPAEASPLAGSVEADLAIVGAGFTGLWAAVMAKEERPEREIVLLEAETAGWGASGRNGGFIDASLTNGLRNGAELFALAGGGLLVAAIGGRATLALAGGVSMLAGLAGLAVYLARRGRSPAAVGEATEQA